MTHASHKNKNINKKILSFIIPNYLSSSFKQEVEWAGVNWTKIMELCFFKNKDFCIYRSIVYGV